MMRLLYLHGLESGPNGEKVRYLRGLGTYEVTAPQLPTEAVAQAINARRTDPRPLSLDEMRQLHVMLKPAIDVAQQAVDASRPDVVIGSSFGGGVACAMRYDGPLVLLAPAARKLFAIDKLGPRSGRVVVLHGRRDSVVPLDDSVQLAAQSACEVALWLVDDEHRLLGAVAAGALPRAIALACGEVGREV